MPDLDPYALVLSLVIGMLGAGIALYGKKQVRIPHIAVGMVLCIYPYFVSNLFLMAGIAVLLCAGLWGATKLGL